MELFKDKIIIKSWGVVYLGLKKEWLTKEKVYSYCKKGLILCSEERLIELYLIENDNLIEFYELIKNFISQDKHLEIKWNEDSNKMQFDIIPRVYYCFWEIEFLSRIINNETDKEKALHKVADLHSDFNYLEAWHSFIYYMPIESKSDLIGIDGLYSNLLEYINKQKSKLKSSSMYIMK